jgi:transposase
MACPGWAGWKDVIVARPYPKEFRDDVVRVARNREDGVTIDQIAADFGVHPMTLWKWLRQADIDDGPKSGKTTESAELRELRRRNRLLEQENEVLRRAAAYLSQSNLPGKGFTRS